MYQAATVCISAAKTAFIGLGVYVTLGIFRASLEWTLNKHQILVLPHCLICSDQRLPLSLDSRKERPDFFAHLHPDLVLFLVKTLAAQDTSI